MSTLNEFVKPSKWVQSESRHIFYKPDLSALICHFCEKLMIAHAALVLKFKFAPRFASIQSILDFVDFFGTFRGHSG